jgi:hypothetical protein
MVDQITAERYKRAIGLGFGYGTCGNCGVDVDIFARRCPQCNVRFRYFFRITTSIIPERFQEVRPDLTFIPP